MRGWARNSKNDREKEKLAFLAQVIKAHTGDLTLKDLAMSGMAHQDAARVEDVRIGMPVEKRKEWQCARMRRSALSCSSSSFSSIVRWPC